MRDIIWTAMWTGAWTASVASMAWFMLGHHRVKDGE